MYRSNERGSKRAIHRWLLVCVACLCAAMMTLPAFGQAKITESESSFCSADDALESIRSQIETSRLIDNARRRITVLIRAADLLWPSQENQARAAFSEAFEIAQRDEKEKREKAAERRSLLMAMESPDQRYVVIRAVTKRDPAWARKLREQAIEANSENPDQSPRDSFNQTLIGQKMLDAAAQLIATDNDAALDLARASLRYPASFMLAGFLYKLAETNQPAADKFYDQALSTYSDRPMREFLYMATYPFGLRTSGDTPVFGFYAVPEGFVINKALQRRFVVTLIRRAEQALTVPLDEGDNFNGLPGLAHILQIIVQIEPQVRRYSPDLTEPLVAARETLLVSLPTETQKLFASRDNITTDPKTGTFVEKIEEAEKTPNANARDDRLVDLIMSASEKEALPAVLEAVNKVSDASFRQMLLEWLYFNRALNAIKQKKFSEAEGLARKIDGLETRAYVHLQLGKELIKKAESQARGRELFDEAASEANKAGQTIFAARILLTASNLYAKLDLNRSLSILAEAIKVINHLESPEFAADNQTSVKELRRKTSGRFVFRFYMPGLNPETAFRELAKVDFNDALSQTAAFTDKFERAMATLAVADVCLQETARRRSEKPKKAPGL